MKKFLLLLTMGFFALSNVSAAVTWYLNEDFESGQIPASWTQEVLSSNVAYWVIEPTSAATYPATGNESNYYVALRNLTDFDQFYRTRLITPPMNLAASPSLFQPQLIFRHAQPAYRTDFDTLRVFYRSNANSQWTLMKVFDEPIDDWREDTLFLMGLTGATAYQLAFEHSNNMGLGTVVDDVRVRNSSSCVAATDIMLSVPGANSVLLTWTGDLSTDSFEVVVSELPIVDWTSYTATFHGYATDFQIEATGLTPSTNYYAYVRAHCYDSEEDWTDWASTTFETRAQVAGLPYVEQFAKTFPEGWSHNSNLSGKPSFSTGASYSIDSTYALVFNAITANKYAYAALPELSGANLQDVEVRFWGYAASNIEVPGKKIVAKLLVGVMTDPDDLSTFVTVDSVKIDVAYQHKKFAVSLRNYGGNGKYITFMATDPDRNSYFYIDKLEVLAPAVLTPSDVRVSNVTPNGFDVTANLHGASSWNIRVARSADYKHLNELPSSFLFSQNGITGSTFHVNGSFPDSIVSIYVQAVNGGQQSEWAFPVTVRVPARATLPLVYDFNLTDSLMLVRLLDNEIRMANGSKAYHGLYFPFLDLSTFYPSVTTATTKPVYEGSHLKLSGIGRWVTLPYIDSFTGMTLTFRLAAASAGQSRVAVGVMTDPYDIATFEELAIFDGGAGAYVKCEVDMSEYTGNGHYLAIKAIAPAARVTTGGGSINHIDKLIFGPTSDCLEAAVPHAIVGDRSASITWNGRGMQRWQFVLSKEHVDSIVATREVNSASISFTDLDAQTAYFYRINTLCGSDTLFGENVYSFFTPYTMPFLESFSTNKLPAGWDNSEGSTTTASYKWTSNTSGKSGRCLRFNSLNNPAGNDNVLASAPILLQRPAELRFQWKNAAGGPAEVQISTDGGATRTTLLDSLSLMNITDWTKMIVDLNGYTGQCAIFYFVATSNHGTGDAYMYLDEVEVDNRSTCFRPSNLEVTKIGEDGTADVSWTLGYDETQWQYVCLRANEELNWDNATIVSTPQVTLTGLSGITTYTIYVRAYCGVDDQSDYLSNTFTTPCSAISAPFFEDFSKVAAGAIPQCWNNDMGTMTNSSYKWSGYTESQNKCLRLNSFSASRGQYNYLATPSIDLTVPAKLTFSWKNPAGGAGEVLISTAGDTTHLTSLMSTGLTGITNWTEMEINLAAYVGQTVTIYFKGTSNYGSGDAYLYLDNVRLSVVDINCLGMISLRASASSAHEGVINWSVGGTQSADIEVSTSPTFANKTEYPGVTTSPLVLSNLEENTVYYVRAHQSCDTENEPLVTSFKTLCRTKSLAEWKMETFTDPSDLNCWSVGYLTDGSSGTVTLPTVDSTSAMGNYLFFSKEATHITTSDTTTYADAYYAIMPMLDVDSINHYEVAFRAAKTNNLTTNLGRLSIGIITDPGDFSTFTSIQTLNLEYAPDSMLMKNYVVSFHNYLGDYNDDFGKFIMFFAQAGDSAIAIAVDNVEVREVSACPQVVEGEISKIEDTSAMYSWISTGAPSYTVSVFAQPGNPDEMSPVFTAVVTSDTVTITGLNPITYYYAFVKAHCTEGDANWSAHSRFRTACGPVALPYEPNLDYTNEEALDCWVVGNKQSGTATYIPSINSKNQLYFNACRYIGSSSSTMADSAYVILPEMNFGEEGIAGYTLSLNAYAYVDPSSSNNGYYNHLLVGVVERGENITSFVRVADLELGPRMPEVPYDVSFGSYIGNGGRIALLAIANPDMASHEDKSYQYGRYYVQDIRLAHTSSCPTVGQIEANVSRRTIDVHLLPKREQQPAGYEFVCSVSPLSDAQLESADKVHIDSTGLYTVTGLNRGTLYYLYARVDCGEEVSEWLSKVVKTQQLENCDDIRLIGANEISSDTLPTDSYYNYGVSEQIYTPAEIGGQGKISSIAFFNAGSEKTRDVTIYMLHTNKSAFTSATDWVNVSSNDLIFSGEVDFVANDWITFPLSKEFVYNGRDNLLLVMDDNTGTWSSGLSCAAFTGADNQVMYEHQDTYNNDPSDMSGVSGTRLAKKNHLQISFCHTIDPCPALVGLTAEMTGNGTDQAIIRWDNSGDDFMGSSDVILSETEITDFTGIVPTISGAPADSVLLTGLQAETTYYVYVRAICNAEGADEGVSDWAGISFTTLPPCPGVVGLAAELTDVNAMSVSWSTAYSAQPLAFAYVHSTEELSAAELASAEKHYINGATAFDLTDLAYDQTYHIYVASVCGEEFSAWSEISARTDGACSAARNLRIRRLQHNLIELGWDRSLFGTEHSWEVGLLGDASYAQVVDDTAQFVTAMIIGLTPETNYTAYVRTLCAGGAEGDQITLNFTTPEMLDGGCVTVGEMEGSSQYLPSYGYYNYSFSEQIYRPEEVGNTGKINGISFYNVATSQTRTIDVYLATTNKTSFSGYADWVPVSPMNKVFSGSVNFVANQWTNILFSTQFEYDGMQNLLIAIDDNSGTYVFSTYMYCAGFNTVDTAALYICSDTANYNPSNMASRYGNLMKGKNTIQVCFDASGGCLPVTNVAVSDLTNRSATISWEPQGSERSWVTVLSESEVTDFRRVTVDTVYSYTAALADLQADKDYWFYIKPPCDASWRVATFTTMANCSAPIDLSVMATTEETADLVWSDAFSAGMSYTVAYGEASTFNVEDTTTYQTVFAHEQHITLTGLQQGTEYAFAVKAICSVTESSRFSEQAIFRTQCGIISQFPWNENFESREVAVLDAYCWNNEHVSGGGSRLFSVSATEQGGNASHKLYLPDMSAGTITRLSLPLMNVPANYEFSLDIFRNATSSSYDAEGVRIFAAYDDGEVELAFISRLFSHAGGIIPAEAETGWYTYELPLPKAGECRIIVQGESQWGAATYLDNFLVLQVPSCAKVGPLNVSAKTDNSATVVWTAGGSETQWQYICVPAGSAVDWSNATIVNAPSANISGLNASTEYDVYVRSYCGGSEFGMARSTTFITECGIISLPWSENFNSLPEGGIPYCWDNSEGTTSSNSYKWSYYVPSSSYNGGNCQGTGVDGSNCIRFDSYSNSNGNTNVLATPFINLSEAATLKFAWKNPAGGAATVKISEMGDTTRVTLVGSNQLEDVDDWTVIEADLSDYVGKMVKIYFESISNYGSQGAYHFLDNLQITIVDPNCGGVKNLSVSNISVSSATIGWEVVTGADHVHLQIATDAAFENILDSASFVDMNTYRVSGLQQGATYYVRARQICDHGMYSKWTATTAFSTPAYGLPYVPVFSSTLPNDWTFSSTPASDVFAGVAMNSIAMGSGSATTSWNKVAADEVINSYHFKGNIYGTTWHYWAISPSVDMTEAVGKGILLSVDAGMIPFSSSSSATYTGVDDRFLVAVSTDGGATWKAADVVAEWNNSGTGDYAYNDVPTQGQTYRINMTDYAGQSVRLGFYGESTVSNADNWFHFGNIRLETVETINYVDTLCEGYSFHKHGFDVDYTELQPGLNIFSRYDTVGGATSITIQQIIVNTSSENEIYVDICEGEHYNGYGFDFTATTSQTYRHRMRSGNVFGCDSTVYLHANVLKPVHAELHVGCNEDSYTWNGKTYYQSTIAHDTTSSVITGCDSITILYLTFCDKTEYSYHGVFCEGGSYSDEFFENLTAPGEYRITVEDEVGCETNAHVILHSIPVGSGFVDTVQVKNLPYVLGNDTLCPITDRDGFVYHGLKDFGCGMVNVTIYVVDGSGLNNVVAGTLSIAPNPVRVGEDIRILTSIDLASDYSCRVFDAVGKLVYESHEPATIIPGLSVAGLYSVRISSGSALYQGKLIVK